MKETILFHKIEIEQNNKEKTCSTCKHSENGKYDLCCVEQGLDRICIDCRLWEAKETEEISEKFIENELKKIETNVKNVTRMFRFLILWFVIAVLTFVFKLYEVTIISFGNMIIFSVFMINAYIDKAVKEIKED